MHKPIEIVETQALEALKAVNSAEELRDFKVRFLGKKGNITALLKGMRDLSPEDRPRFGALVNGVKKKIEDAVDKQSAIFETEQEQRLIDSSRLDVTLPGRTRPRGHLSPLSLVYREAIGIFERMGFAIESGPEVETDYYNFEALNFPPDHPARDMQDTLFVSDNICLRTHTSPVQVRVMEKTTPPIRMICPGWVFRADTLDASHSPMFSQIEGLLVDRRVTLGDLFGVLDEFVRRFFGQKVKTRYRPSFFPFTEPSQEVDITCIICGGTGRIGGSTCRVCKGTGWKEILGCGMVDPNVFEAVGYDPEQYTGFAFGMGIERIAMFKYGIDEIRHFFEGDLRFVKQF